MHSLSVQEARANLYRLIDEVAEHHKPIEISGKRNGAVLVSTDRSKISACELSEGYQFI